MPLLRTMAVARLIKCRYQKARDLMLSGVLGETSEDEDGKMVVERAGVVAWIDAQAASPRAKQKAS